MGPFADINVIIADRICLLVDLDRVPEVANLSFDVLVKAGSASHFRISKHVFRTVIINKGTVCQWRIGLLCICTDDARDARGDFGDG